jgi:hypothetical protein
MLIPARERLAVWGAGLIAGALALIWIAHPAQAGGVVGDGTPASCTESALRAALNHGGVVTFRCGSQPVTITLTGELRLTRDVEIDGGGPEQGGRIILDGGHQTRLIWLENITLTLRNLTLVRGRSDKGGAVRAVGYSARVVVDNSIFRDNDGTAGPNEAGGGAISMHYGQLHVEDSLFEDNRGINGGAIYNLRCPVTILRSVFRRNSSAYGGVVANFGFGGAVYNDGAGRPGVGGRVVIHDSLFISNTARNFGGAVYTYLYYPDSSEIARSLFSGNVVLLSNRRRASGGGLMHHNGPLSLRDSTFINNLSQDAGGAVLVAQTTITPGWNYAHLTNLTVVGNRADSPDDSLGSGGGLFFNGGQVTVTNVTLADNYADQFGGAIYNTTANAADVLLRNVIIGRNRLGRAHSSAQCAGALRGAPNLQSPGDGVPCVSGIALADPGLDAAVGYHGGALPTLALRPTSPAIDAGADCPPFDQRGIPRVGRCDLGAFEYLPPRAFIPTASRNTP